MLLDHQIGFADESTYAGTPAPAVTRFFEFNTEDIAETEGRTLSTGLRVGTYVDRADRFTPYFEGAAGNVEMDVLTKGFGYFLKHMLGSVSTSAVADSLYTHTGTMGDLWGDSFVMQVGRPLNPSGTVQPFTYLGGKVTDWELANAVNGNLVLTLGTDFAQVDTTAGLATASYPSAMEPLTWAGGVVSVGGATVDVTEITIKGENALKTDRRFIRGNTDKKQPTSGRRSVEVALKLDFESMAMRNRVHALTRSAAIGQVEAQWTAPTLAGTSSKPFLRANMPTVRFDEWKAAIGGPEGIDQEVTGVVVFDGTNSPVTIQYGSTDATA